MTPHWWKHSYYQRGQRLDCMRAPCSVDGAGFQVAIVLPKGTNLPLEEKHEGWEDALITAKNKWLIGHAEGGLPEGSHIGLIGENISVK